MAYSITLTVTAPLLQLPPSLPAKVSTNSPFDVITDTINELIDHNNKTNNIFATENTTYFSGNCNFDSGTLFVDAVNHRIGVGISTTRTNLLGGTIAPVFQIEGTDAASTLSVVRNTNSTAMARMYLSKTRGTTTGNNTIVQDNDQLGGIEFGGADGTNIRSAARIAVEVDGTPTSNTFVPGRIIFATANSTNVDPVQVVQISANGNVGIATTTPGYKLEVNGSFAATTKSFVIPHPTKPNMKLRYASLEGPENGVYVRGKSTASVIELPDYWSTLVDANSVSVFLLSIGCDQKLYVASMNTSHIVVNSSLWGSRFRWRPQFFYLVFGERQDVPRLPVEVPV